ncbi:aspartate kinase [Oceanobacillus sp. FSL H7-0719]|uniref:aspartate kinase n=1 Tax=Oceanobacillus sp. FSL H7-0719 TaxID=2954507 RepID=UPI00324CE115
MQLLVQKFGGSSLQTSKKRLHVMNHIKEALEEHDKIIVVVSAIGKHPSPYATDSLLKLVNYPITHAADRELDLLLACGEIISAVVLSNELKQKGINAIALTGAQAGITTNDYHTNAKIKYVDPSQIMDTLQSHDVIVVAGFQGETDKGEVTTIGRGGSDTTAAALGAAVKAVRADIFTDVPGIMTADPRIVEHAQILKNCTYTETCNLAYQGAKVIHPHAVEIAMQAKLPLHVRATEQKTQGTFISAKYPENKKVKEVSRPITGIAHLTGISQVKISRKDNPSYSMSEIFKTIAAAGISIDFINISPHQVIFTLPETVVNRAKGLLQNLDIKAEISEHCAKVSAVGMGMSGIPGVAARIVTALAKKGIQILQAADSHTTIWVLIHEKDLRQAVNALHDVFELSKGNRVLS